MADTQACELPDSIWKRIGEYADIDVREGMRMLKLPQVAFAEYARRRAREIEQSFMGIPALGISMDRRDMLSREALLEYSAWIEPQEAQHASLYEMLLEARMSHDQTFPMRYVMEDGEVLNLHPPFNPIAQVDLVLRPVDDYSRLMLERAGLQGANPWTFRYLVRKLGLGEMAAGLPAEDYRTVKIKRRAILGIKAYWYAMLIAGSLPNALAREVDDFLGEDGEALHRYVKLWNSVWGWVIAFMKALLSIVMRVGARVNLDWYRAMNDEGQALVELLVIAGILVLCWHFTKGEQYNLVPAKAKKADRFLGQVLGEKGMVYRVRVKGREYTLTADEETGNHQDEMAMPGSEYFPCRAQPVGALLVTTSHTDVQIFGMFWRMDDYLVTARHCSNTLNQSTAKVYLASIRPTKKGNFEVNRSTLYRVDEDFFAPENNVIASYDIDAFAREVDVKVWSQIGLTKASTRVRSQYGQQVHSVGFTTDGLLVSAAGKTLPGSGYEHLHHTASTQKGFSGSIILCGNSVVGMHVSAAGDHNVAVRTELIQYLIDEGTNLESQSKNRKKYTYADASYREHYRQHKWRGGIVNLKQMRDGKFAIVLENGEATYGWDLHGLVECFGLTGNPAKDEDYLQDMLMDQAGYRLKVRERYVDFDDDRYHRNSYENASVAGSMTSSRSETPFGRRSRGGKNRARESVDRLRCKVEAGLKPIHGPAAPKMQPEAIQVIEDYKEEIVALGYEEGSFEYPQMNPETERVSLEKHLTLFADRVSSISVPPTDSEMKRCAAVVATMLQPASYVPDADYNQISGVLDVINSSIVDPSKASGYPYCIQGQPINKQVLESYGEQGFAQHVINEWNTLEFFLKNFIKGEPTKLKKLKAGMPRVVEGFPLHITVKHAAVFRRLAMSMVKHWKSIPVKYAFSPANPGHIEHLAGVLPGKVWESDKSNWDYMFHQWIAETCRETVKLLAVRNPDWSEEEYQHYLSDVDNCFRQVFQEAIYRTSDGHSYKPHFSGLMKSGWFLTIVVNSIAQLSVHVMICMRLGMTDEEILSIPIVAGGDDVEQEPVPAGKDAYVQVSSTLGVDMEIHERESLFHSEYFSSDLRKGPDGPQFFPKRWTKHIEHLKVVKREHLADALCSHMENYRHDLAKFTLLENMYHSLRDKYPDEFPISRLVSRNLLLARQYGYEHMMC